MPYKIISPRLGEPGTEYDAEGATANGINVEALVAKGFLELSAPKPKKPAKNSTDINEEN